MDVDSTAEFRHYVDQNHFSWNTEDQFVVEKKTGRRLSNTTVLFDQ